METIVDRDVEVKLIDEAFTALQSYEEEFLRTPILDFYGIEGIGKTTILKYIEQKCEEYSIPYISIDARKNIQELAHDMSQQTKQYTKQNEDKESLHQEAPLGRSIYAIKALLSQKTAVLLMDAVDATNYEQMQWIEGILQEVIDGHKLFVVLTSKRSLFFEKERSVARKLNTIQLGPFNRQNSETYLDKINARQDPEVRGLILEWTKGYPLAMEVLVQTINEQGLDPKKKEDRQKLLTALVDRVLYKKVLVRVKPPVLAEHYAALQLLSIPRRFNLVILQELIENFAPQLKRESSLAYMNLPKSINQNTDILNWDMLKAGFAVDSPVRNIFLLQNKIEQPVRYERVHRFLAQLNQQFAGEVNGSDRIRYLREYLYHSTHTEKADALRSVLENTIQQVAQESPGALQEFSEEFSRDEELLEILGEAAQTVFSLIHRHLAEEHRRAAQKSSGNEQMQHLRYFLRNVIDDPQVPDLEAALSQSIADILAEQPPEQWASFAETLLQNDEFKQSLGERFELLSLLVQKHFSSEG